MCLEDLKIMGHTYAFVTRIPLGAAAALIIPASPTRVGLLFMPHFTIDYFVSIDQTVAQSNGIDITNRTQAPSFGVLLTLYQIGRAISQPWFGISNGAAFTGACMEIHLNEEWAKKAELM